MQKESLWTSQISETKVQILEDLEDKSEDLFSRDKEASEDKKLDIEDSKVKLIEAFVEQSGNN